MVNCIFFLKEDYLAFPKMYSFLWILSRHLYTILYATAIWFSPIFPIFPSLLELWLLLFLGYLTARWVIVGRYHSVTTGIITGIPPSGKIRESQRESQGILSGHVSVNLVINSRSSLRANFPVWHSLS